MNVITRSMALPYMQYPAATISVPAFKMSLTFGSPGLVFLNTLIEHHDDGGGSDVDDDDDDGDDGGDNDDGDDGDTRCTERKRKRVNE
jgi:hypothetical protein